MTTSLPATRAARLDRLRTSRDAWPGPAGGMFRAGGAGQGLERRARLAAQLGGRPCLGRDGPVVVVETRTALPALLDGLADLPEPLDPSRPLVCLDTETTGLGSAAGTVPFLVGLGTWQGGDFVVRQLVLADHPDEPALLGLLAELLPDDAQLVTYNGRSFDWPLLVTRYRLHRVEPPRLAAHLDLLPLARRVWRHRLPDARLASVETGVCGVARDDDLPGADIPGRFLDWLRTGDAAPLHDVLQHNRQDVVSLALLLRVLSEVLVPAGPGWSPGASREPSRGQGTPGMPMEPADLGGLGTAFSRRGQHVRALSCFESALERIRTPGELRRNERISVERARTLARLGLRTDAEGAWEAIALEGGHAAALAWVQVAKHREHDRGDLWGALAATERARSMAERARLFGWPDRLVERDLARRVPRLRRRLAAEGHPGAS